MSEKILYEVHDLHVGDDVYSFFFTEKHFIAFCARRASRAAELGWSLLPNYGAISGVIQGGLSQIGEKKRQKKQQENIEDFRVSLQQKDPEQLIRERNLKTSFLCNYNAILFETIFRKTRKKKPPTIVIQCNNYHIKTVNWDETLVTTAASILINHGAIQATKLKAGFFKRRVNARRD